MKSKPPIIILLSVLLILILTSATPKLSYFETGGKKFLLRSSILANESFGTNSKFEIDLLQAKDAGVTVTGTYIYLSLASNSQTELGNGKYIFNEDVIHSKKPFVFSGVLSIDNKPVKIRGGSFAIVKKRKILKMDFLFKLENGESVKGYYEGTYQQTDRRKNN
ncbi:MAG: hypothetical protein H7Y13_08975 [Sphingobacteriaceae bacterium]|nr:hypothetical protein [Sphingobacteriaceae bacterium]